MSGKLKDPEEEMEDLFEPEYDDDPMSKLPVQDIMQTPLGLWRVNDTMNPYKQFKLWMGHTNFTITSDVVDIIQDIPGVEVLQVMTRYRFIIGVGELFSIRDVRVAIESQLDCNMDIDSMISDQQVLQEVHELEKTLSVYDKWAIYVFPNGELDWTHSGEEDFGTQLNIYKDAVDHSSGLLIEGNNE
jgi:hypothetical protein